MVVYQTNYKTSSTTASVVLSNNMNNEKQQQQNSHTVVNDVNHEKNQTTTSSSLTKQITPIPEVFGMLLSQIQNDKTPETLGNIPTLDFLNDLFQDDKLNSAQYDALVRFLTNLFSKAAYQKQEFNESTSCFPYLIFF